MHWKPEGQRGLAEDRIRKSIDRATEFRRRILQNADAMPYALLQQELALADEALQVVRFIGDATVAAFFSAENDRGRLEKREQLLAQMSRWLHTGSPDDEAPINAAIAGLRGGEKPIQAFHWQIEFPEVFDRANSGFDAIVGNPPFAGRNSLLTTNRDGYLDWLIAIHDGSHGNADLVAHFFRRAFNLIRPQGTFGLIATNTIRQGDTRSTALRWICTRGGVIFAARRRYKWPGIAAVVVSVVHIAKGGLDRTPELDGKHVDTITAFLFHHGGHEDAQPLFANANKSFQGSIVLGMGFTFDGTTHNSAANSLAEMEALIAKDPRNAERIFPYIGGEEVLTSPTQSPHRYVIDFFDRSLEEAAQWPELLEIVRRKVKPERDKQKRDANRDRWWQYAEKRPGLYPAIARLTRVLVIPRIGQHAAFVFLHAGSVFSEQLVVFPFDTNAAFCTLQARPHEIWARFFSSSMKDDLRYTPTDCFETFPFPADVGSLESSGQEYYEFRAANDYELSGLDRHTYNRFHHPNETSPEIMKLRELHAAMDRAVLDAYGWTDLNPACEFLLDYEEEEDEDSGRRKKPWRYRWPDDFRDEVLARLLELNEQRAEEERIAGIVAEAETSKGAGKTKKTKKAKPDSPKLEGF